MTIAMAGLPIALLFSSKAGSFRSKIDLGMDRLLATNNGICFGELCYNTNLPTTNSADGIRKQLYYSILSLNLLIPLPGPGTYK
jgi:hypothetical protein